MKTELPKIKLPKVELPEGLKKRLPLLLAVVGVFVIGAAGAFIYTAYFADGPAKKTPPVQAKAPQAQPPKATTQPSQPQPQPQQPQAQKAPQQGKPQENKKPEAAPAVAAQDAAEKAKTAAYEYNPKGRRDPFATLIVKAAPERKRGLTPMENVETGAVRLIAVLWNKSGYYAVITLPDGKSYTIREGVKLGLNGGSVHKITRNSVIIREQARDERGRLSRKDITLKLRREEEG